MKKIILIFVFILGLNILAIAQGNEFPVWATYLEGYDIRQIFDSDDFLWLQAGNEIIQLDKATRNIIHHSFESTITDIADAGNCFWLLTNKEEITFNPEQRKESQELLKFEKATGNIVSYNFDYYDSEKNNKIKSIYCDNNGLPWIYSIEYNIFRMTENEDWILVLPKSSDIEDDLFSDICFAKDNVVWISRGKILIKYKDNKVEIIEANGFIGDLTLDMKGNIWTRLSKDQLSLRSSPSVIAKFDGSKWSNYYNSQMTLGILKILDNGIIWILGISGDINYIESYLIKYDSTNYNITYKPPINILISSVDIDGEEQLWIGTANSGLIKFDASNWLTYDVSNSDIPSNQVNSIFIDTDGTKWIGTENGLAIFNEKGITTTSSNIYSNTIEKIELYPNPASNFVTLKIPKQIQNSTVDILNIQGKVIKSIPTYKNQNRIDLNQFPDGVYLVKIQTDEHYIVKKFVKQ